MSIGEILHNSLDKLPVNMPDGGSTILNIVLGIVMFGVALGIKPSSFIDVFKNPKSLIIGIVCQSLLLPALTFLLIIACGDIISPMVALGMILVAACPGGNISNFITSLSRGNNELSVSLTAINTAVCIFTTPLNFSIWGNLYIKFAQNHHFIDLSGYLNQNGVPTLSMPFWDIFQSIVIIMGIPLVIGVLCAHYWPKVADALKNPLQKLSIVVFIAMVVIIFTGNMDTFLKCIKYIALIVFVHNLLALGIGYGTATLLKTPYKDRRTLTIESGIQNSGLGLALLFNPNIFDPAIWSTTGLLGGMGGMMVITAWWGVWHIVSGLTLAFLWRWKGRKEPNE